MAKNKLIFFYKKIENYITCSHPKLIVMDTEEYSSYENIIAPTIEVTAATAATATTAATAATATTAATSAKEHLKNSGFSDGEDPKNIIFAIDQSISMRSTLESCIKRLNATLIDHLKDGFGKKNVHVTVVGFSDVCHIKILKPRTPLSEITEIENLRVINDTAIYSTIVFLDNLIKTEGYIGTQNMIIFLTDGEENSSSPQDTHAKVSEILQGYLKTLAEPKTSVAFIFAGANQNAVTTAAGFGLPPTSALTFHVNNFEGCFNALGNMLGRVANDMDSTPSVNPDDRMMSCPGNDDYNSSYVHAQNISGPPNDCMPSAYDDETPSYSSPMDYEDDSVPSCRFPI